MKQLWNDILDSLLLYGMVSFVLLWLIVALVWFDYAEWLIPYLFTFMLCSLPILVFIDLIFFGLRVLLDRMAEVR